MPDKYSGSCHCGALKVEYLSAVAPGAAEVRECQCSFCRMHGAQAVSDPGGKIRFSEQIAGALHRYSFGLRTADFLLCANCGAYMGAVTNSGSPLYGIVNILTLDGKSVFSRQPIASSYDSEDKPQRIARRAAKWTPATVLLK